MHKALKKIKGKRPPHVSFLYGAEPYFRFRILKEARRHYKALGYDIEEVDGSKVKDRELADLLDTNTLFAGGDKFVVVSNTHRLKGKVPALMQYLEEPSEDVVVVFDYDATPKRGQKEAALTPLGKALKEHAYTYESKPFSRYKNDHAKWLIEEAAAQGKTLPEGLARAIHLNTGDSLFAIANALRKVILHSDGDVVEKADLKAVLARTATNQAYELTNAFGARDLRKSLRLLDAFYHQAVDEPAVWITSTLLNHIEKLIRAKSLLAYGLDPKDAAKVLNMSPWVFSNQLKPQLDRFKLSELLKMYDDICRVDLLVKGSGLSRRAILESFLVRSLS